MPWITLTPDDLQGRLTAGEIATLTAVAGNGDTLQRVIDEVTDEVRGYAGSAGPVGTDGTIPSETKNAALSLVVLRYLSQTPSSKLITETRTKAAETALTLLRDVAVGKFRIAPPTVAAPAAEQAARPTTLTIQPGNCGNSREDLRRL